MISDDDFGGGHDICLGNGFGHGLDGIGGGGLGCGGSGSGSSVAGLANNNLCYPAPSLTAEVLQ